MHLTRKRDIQASLALLLGYGTLRPLDLPASSLAIQERSSTSLTATLDGTPLPVNNIVPDQWNFFLPVGYLNSCQSINWQEPELLFGGVNKVALDKQHEGDRDRLGSWMSRLPRLSPTVHHSCPAFLTRGALSDVTFASKDSGDIATATEPSRRFGRGDD
jgi:hypothetical protein